MMCKLSYVTWYKTLKIYIFFVSKIVVSSIIRYLLGMFCENFN